MDEIVIIISFPPASRKEKAEWKLHGQPRRIIACIYWCAAYNINVAKNDAEMYNKYSAVLVKVIVSQADFINCIFYYDNYVSR